MRDRASHPAAQETKKVDEQLNVPQQQPLLDTDEAVTEAETIDPRQAAAIEAIIARQRAAMGFT